VHTNHALVAIKLVAKRPNSGLTEMAAAPVENKLSQFAGAMALGDVAR
jgi:hypothetical protein